MVHARAFQRQWNGRNKVSEIKDVQELLIISGVACRIKHDHPAFEKLHERIEVNSPLKYDGIFGTMFLLQAQYGYVAKPDAIIIATGSEVSLAMGARVELAKRNLKARVVSLPSWELFDAQSRDYRESVLPPAVKTRLAIEAGVAQGWHKYVGDQGKIMSIERFGASAPAGVLAEKFGFTVDAVVTVSRQMRGDITQKL